MSEHARRRQPRAEKPAFRPAYFTRWRESFLALNSSFDSLGLANGLFLGDSSTVAEPAERVFRTAGLAHLLAADGLKCWFVSSALDMLLALGLAAFRALSPARVWLALGARARPAARLAGAWLYWLWSRQSAAVTRAALMISERHALELTGFPVTFPRLLLFQYLASLVIFPSLWWQAGFQLSYGCVLGMIALPRLVSAREPRGRVTRAIWRSLCASLGAALGAFPAGWIFFGELNLNGVLTHALATPPVTLAILPVEFLEMLALLPGLELIHEAAEPLARASATLCRLLLALVAGFLRVIPDLRY